MQINLSKFKKIKDSPDSATLMHPEGHHFTIAKNALSKKMQGELSSIPLHYDDGGGVPNQNAQQTTAPAGSPIVINVGQPPQQQAPLPSADPDTTPMNIPSVVKNTNPQVIMNDASLSDEQKTNILSGYNQQNHTEQTQAQAEVQKQNAQHEALMKQAQVAGIQTPEQAPIGGASNPGGAVTSQIATPSNQPPSDPYGTEAYYGAMNRGIGEQKAGLAGEASALGEQGKKEAAALDQGIKQQQQGVADFQANNKAFQLHQQQFLDDYQNQHIDPQHYLSSMGTGKKIATAIGLILGGMSTGFTHQENPALKFLQNQIDLDVRAQETEIGKKRNLLEANRQFYGDMGTAIQATTAQQMGIVSSQLKKAAAEAQDPLAKARALQAAGQLDEKIAPILSQMAMRKTILNGMQSGAQNPSMTIRMLVPDNHQAAAYKELGEVQEQVKAKDNALRAFDDLAKINTVGNNITSPLQTPRQVKSTRDIIAVSLARAAAGRVNEYEFDAAKNLYPLAGDTEETLQKKRQNITHLVQEKMNAPILSSYGINPFQNSKYGDQGTKKIQLGAPVIK